MAGQCICCNPQDLKNTASAYNEAASGFNQAKSAFEKSGTGNPGFGLFMMLLYPAYTVCKMSTQGYLGNIGQMSERLSSALKSTSEISEDTESQLRQMILDLRKQVEEQDQRITELEHHQDGDSDGGNYSGGGSAGGGGYTGGGAAGGGYGSGGSGSGSGATGIADSTDKQSINVPSVSSATDAISGAHASTGSDTGSAREPIRDTGKEDAASDIGGTRNDSQIGQIDTVPLPNQTTKDTISTIGLDVDGDASDDYSLNLTNGNTHAVVGEDGSVTLSKQDGSSVPLPPGAQEGKNDFLTVDANHDGIDDIAFTPDTGADARISVFEQGDSQYMAIDADNDGDYDVVARVGDSEAAYEAMHERAEESAWQSIASKDPLGRTADELRALYQDRDVVELPERSEIR